MTEQLAAIAARLDSDRAERSGQHLKVNELLAQLSDTRGQLAAAQSANLRLVSRLKDSKSHLDAVQADRDLAAARLEQERAAHAKTVELIALQQQQPAQIAADPVAVGSRPSRKRKISKISDASSSDSDYDCDAKKYVQGNGGSDANEYQVEAILDVRRDGRDFVYHVQWAGYSDTTWEPYSELQHPDLVVEFHANNPDKPNPCRKRRL
ncbi:hypothetical protein H9P43_008639 [Blastocladiella emersonii ATCC 22665]|nr:hypothetical protein H9P43_008639 [Blastocladiella emersonii ATCC 22665]